MNTKYHTDTIALKKRMLDMGFDKITVLSKAAGVNRDTLGAILSGKVQPSANAMLKLADTLDMPPEMAGNIFFSNNLRNT